MQNIQKKVILVTGSSQGIGRLTAETLAREGHTVYATMRSIDQRNASARVALEALAEAEALDLRVVELDVTDDNSVEAAIATVIEQSGHIDVVVNNAGIMFVGVTEAYTLEKARQQIATPKGARPLRTVVGIDYGVRALNEAVAPTQQGLLEALDMAALATPASAVV